MTNVLAGLMMVALIGGSAGAAWATTPPSAGVAVVGSVAPGCALGAWIKDSGAGQFSGGKDALVTYANGDLVDASAQSIVGAGTAVKVHAPLVCNTAIDWSISTQKGALRNDGATAVPDGFANQWFYVINTTPRTSGGAPAGDVSDILFGNGTPRNSTGHHMSTPDALSIANFELLFSPNAQSAKMLAGNYSEKITLTVSPSF